MPRVSKIRLEHNPYLLDMGSCTLYFLRSTDKLSIDSVLRKIACQLEQFRAGHGQSLAETLSILLLPADMIYGKRTGLKENNVEFGVSFGSGRQIRDCAEIKTLIVGTI